MANTLYQHSAGHYAIDHGNFQDVIGTYYKKGTITDFEVDSENPITITKSHVKVNVDGVGETAEYIPLFYRNKPLYWDSFDGEYSAGEWNEDNKYYEQAWQCFRCGDEVVVQCEKEDGTLVPKRVVGFVDGIPRLGENVFKVQSTPTDICRGNPQWMYFLARPNAIWNGETDKDEWFQQADFGKNWTEECYGANLEFPAPGDITLNQICNDDGSNMSHYTILSAMSGTEIHWYGRDGWVILNSQMSPTGSLVCGTYEGTICECRAWYQRVETHWSYDIHHYYWTVGPIMYCWMMVAAYANTYSDTWWEAKWFRNWEDVYYGDYPPLPETPPCVTLGCDERSYGESYYHGSWLWQTNPSADWDTVLTYSGPCSGTFVPDYCPSATPCEFDFCEYVSAIEWRVNDFDAVYDITGTWFGLSSQGYDYNNEIFACLYKPEIWNNINANTPDNSMTAQTGYYSTWDWYLDATSDPNSYKFIPPKHQAPTSTEE